MSKTFAYSLFGVGKIPEQLAAQLKSEGIRLWDEGIRGSTTYSDFRAPGKYSKWKRRWHTASIVLTEVRLVALQYSQTIIDVPLSDERIRSMQFLWRVTLSSSLSMRRFFIAIGQAGLNAGSTQFRQKTS